MKISNIQMELEEQAQELGFESLEEAKKAGCEVEWHENSAEIVEPLELAHRAWEREKEIVLGDLMNLMIHKVYDHDIIERAYKFVKEAHE